MNNYNTYRDTNTYYTQSVVITKLFDIIIFKIMKIIENLGSMIFFCVFQTPLKLCMVSYLPICGRQVFNTNSSVS